MKQITIVTKNHGGLTADIAAVLGDNNINIESLDAEEVEGMGVVTLTVDHYNRALHAETGRISAGKLMMRVEPHPLKTEHALLIADYDFGGFQQH